MSSVQPPSMRSSTPERPRHSVSSSVSSRSIGHQHHGVHSGKRPARHAFIHKVGTKVRDLSVQTNGFQGVEHTYCEHLLFSPERFTVRSSDETNRNVLQCSIMLMTERERLGKHPHPEAPPRVRARLRDRSLLPVLTLSDAFRRCLFLLDLIFRTLGIGPYQCTPPL